MGGVGGAHLLTLTRLGIGRFTVADGDAFEQRNFNRQVGATLTTLGRNKAEVLATVAREINPELDIRMMAQCVDASNVDQLLEDAEVVVDGIDFFAIGARRLVFARARARNIPVITCAPLGFSAAALTFTPQGPSFDAFMAIHEGMDEREQLLRFAVGLAPAGLHVPYIDPSSVRFAERRGPSSVIAANLCAAVAAIEVLNLLLHRQPVLRVPQYAQFDPYRRRYRIGTVWGGNRNPSQQVKLWYLRRRLRAQAA
jgi:hypothetical protein